MRTLRSVVLALAAVCLAVPAARAEEPYLEFLEGLRGLQYYDYAVLYLDTIRDDPNAPQEIKQLVPFEKAATLLVQSRGVISNPEVQASQLDQALAFLNQFIEESPNHPMAGEANTERARILLGRARVDVWQADSPSNKEARGDYQKSARGLVAQARTIFQTAHDQHKAKWESYPKFIDKAEEPALYDERAQAEVKYMRAQLDLADCTYQEAQTYDAGSEDFARVLKQASIEYEAIHTRYRTQIVGLYARTWQAKCFEEQNDIRSAIGIYNELLAHPGGPGSPLVPLQDQVRQFELICLNHEARKDYQLVVQKADEWLNSKKSIREKNSAIGIGIRWEQTRAQETLAADRAISENDRKKLLQQALSNVRTIKNYPGQYRDLATFKERELNVKLRGEGAAGDPEDFDTAYSLGQELATKKTRPILDRLRDAQAAGNQDEARAAAEDLRLHTEEASRLLRIALRLSDAGTPINDLNLARQYLAYMNLLSRNNYEAAILAEFVATRYGNENPVTSQDAAYIAMAAYVNAFNDNQKAGRRDAQQFDVDRMVNVAMFLIEKWPTSDRSLDARMQLGSVFGQLDQHDKSADWYGQVPEASARYPEAQTRAGQAYWSAYIQGASAEDAARPSQQVLDGWMASAETHLRTGIDLTEKDTPAGTPIPELIVAAKVSLVNILVQKPDYAGAIKLLTQAPHPVMEAIAVPDESKRPRSGAGIKTVQFASLAYQLLLRCYVGTQDLDNARNAMQSLETIGGGGGEQITEIYRSLGEELKKELARLKAANQTARFNEVRQSFETFLGDIARREEQTVGSLTWIAETNFSLADESRDDPAAADKFYVAAAANYQKIIDRAAADASFIDAARLNGVRLRLVNCRRNQGQFEEAEKLVTAVLSANSQALDAQIEANYVYQSWGDGGKPEQYLKAINGGGQAWGWGATSTRLQKQLESGRPDAKERFEDSYYESRYNIARCRTSYGMTLSGARKTGELERAEIEIIQFVSIVGNFDPVWWAKFDAIYQEIQTGLGRIPAPLEKPKTFTPVAVVENSKPEPKKSQSTAKSGSKPAPASAAGDSGGNGLTYAVFGLFALLGIGGGGVMVVKGSKSRRPKSLISQPDESIVIAPPPAEPTSPKRASTPRQPASVTPQAATGERKASAATEKPKRPLTPEEKEILRKRKEAKARQARREAEDGK